MTDDLPNWIYVLGALAGLWIVIQRHQISMLREENKALRAAPKCD